MREKTKLLKKKIFKYLELCNRRDSATDNFNKSSYDFRAQEIKEELDDQIFNLDWDMFLKMTTRAYKLNNIPYFLSSELGESERDYFSEVDNRYQSVSNIRYKINASVGANGEKVESYFDVKSYWGDKNDEKYIGLLELLTENGKLKDLFMQSPKLIDYAFEAYEKTEIETAKREKARLQSQLNDEKKHHKEKMSYIKKLIKSYDVRIKGKDLAIISEENSLNKK